MRYATRVAALAAGQLAAWGAILALIAYDDSAKFLGMPSSELGIWAALSADPRTILLLPMVVLFEQIRDMESVGS